MLLACVEDSWDDGSVWRLTREHSYRTLHDRATRKNDVYALDTLLELREDLDELEEFRLEDITGMRKGQRRHMFDEVGPQMNAGMALLVAIQNMDPDITESEDEDEDEDKDEDKDEDEYCVLFAVAENEMEMEVAVEAFEEVHEVATAENEKEVTAEKSEDVDAVTAAEKKLADSTRAPSRSNSVEHSK